MYVFGDSLSDMGNVSKLTKGVTPPSPPYSRGRFSNGPIWVEYLARKLKLSPNPSTNFAFAGATTGTRNNTGSNGTLAVPALLPQVKDFTAAHPNADPKALYILWAGTNDYLEGVTNPALPLKNLSEAVRLLAAAGAQNILVVDLPDLGKLPVTLNTPAASTLNGLTRAHNSGLSKSLNTLSQQLDSDTHVMLLDVNSLFNQAIADPAKFGFTSVTAPCLANSIVCANPNKFLFWDNIHPTTATHRFLAELAFSKLRSGSR